MLVELLIAIVGTMGLILVALITVGLPLLVSTRRHARNAAGSAAATVHEVKNDHPAPFREDLDDKHGEIMRTLRSFSRRLGRVERRVSEVDERTQPRPITPRRRTRR